MIYYVALYGYAGRVSPLMGGGWFDTLADAEVEAGRFAGSPYRAEVLRRWYPA